jgi:hypothetical protein
VALVAAREVLAETTLLAAHLVIFQPAALWSLMLAAAVKLSMMAAE